MTTANEPKIKNIATLQALFQETCKKFMPSDSTDWIPSQQEFFELAGDILVTIYDDFLLAVKQVYPNGVIDQENLDDVNKTLYAVAKEYDQRWVGAMSLLGQKFNLQYPKDLFAQLLKQNFPHVYAELRPTNENPKTLTLEQLRTIFEDQFINGIKEGILKQFGDEGIAIKISFYRDRENKYVNERIQKSWDEFFNRVLAKAKESSPNTPA